MNLRQLPRRLMRSLTQGPSFAGTDVRIGSNVHFGRNVTFNCRRVRIGDGVVFRDHVTVNADVFEIGDYGTIYDYCFFPGPGELRIGHNFWLGIGSIVDSMGGTTIGNNVCVGAHSQLWTHMKFGDVLYGCRFHSASPLVVDDDAWLSGQCLVSPVKIGARSLAMLGSLVTRNMEEDHVYAGVPAQDVTARFGPQFDVRPIDDRVAWLRQRIEDFARRHPELAIERHVRIVDTPGEMPAMGGEETVFNVADRTYSKHGSLLEHRLMRFLLPDAKFVPAGGASPGRAEASRAVTSS